MQIYLHSYLPKTCICNYRLQVFGHNNGLTFYDHDQFTSIDFSPAKDNMTRVMDIIQDTHGNVWFAASSLGFGRLMDGRKIKWYQVNPTSFAVTIHQDTRGKVWAGTSQKLYYFDHDQLIPYEHNDEINGPVRKLFSTRNGDIMGPGIYGFNKISGNRVTQVPSDDGPGRKSFYCYYQNKAGEEFVGTTSGLYIIEQGRMYKFIKNGIRIDNPVYFIFQDHDENYWFGSHNGVYKWDGKNTFETYSIANGLAGREANRSAGMVDTHGSVWIGTDMGLSCFLPGFSRLKSGPQPVRLLNIEDGKEKLHSITDNCSIGFDANTLFFHFRYMSFINEDFINYRYKLEGSDHKWQYVNQSGLDKIKYSSLKPGDYRLRVQARNGSGNWSAVSASGLITISRPYYLTGWFHGLLILSLAAIIFGVFKIILLRKYYLNLEKEIAERKISEKKTVQTLHALHSSELKYRESVEFAVDGILVVSKDRIITDANSHMQKLVDRKADNLIGMPVERLFSEEHLQKVPLRYDLVEAGETVVNYREILREDGTLIPVEMHTKKLPDGSYQSIYHDITNRRQIEEEIKESRELYKLIADKMTDVVWLMDLDMNSFFVSPSIESFTGFSVDEYLHQTIDDRFAPDSAETVKQIFRNEKPRLLDQPEALSEFRYTVCLEYFCKNGGTKWGELLMTPYFGANGVWVGIHGVTRNITDRKLTEEALKVKVAELERFNTLMIGREMKMIELKNEINELLASTGKPDKYKVHE